MFLLFFKLLQFSKSSETRRNVYDDEHDDDEHDDDVEGDDDDV